MCDTSLFRLPVPRNPAQELRTCNHAGFSGVREDVLGRSGGIGVKHSEGVNLEAPCTTTDGSGDRWYTLSNRSDGDTAAGGGGDGRWQLMGGTGKYAGVTGTCTYDTSYLTQERVVTEAKCAWERS